MEHNSTAGSLDLMHDIIVPPAISFWPLAPGWYALALIVLAYVLHLALKLWTQYRENAYRREALDELSLNEEGTAEMERLLTLMKRVALQHFGRENVAALSGTLWWEFVEQHSKVKVESSLRLLSQKVLYSSDVQVTTEALAKMKKITKIWIKTHGALDD